MEDAVRPQHVVKIETKSTLRICDVTVAAPRRLLFGVDIGSWTGAISVPVKAFKNVRSNRVIVVVGLGGVGFKLALMLGRFKVSCDRTSIQFASRLADSVVVEERPQLAFFARTDSHGRRCGRGGSGSGSVV